MVFKMYFILEVIALTLVIAAGSDIHLKNNATGSGRVLKVITIGSDQRHSSETTGSDQRHSRETTGSDQFIHSVLGTKITVKPGRHVCTAEKVISRPVKVTQTYKKPVYTNHPRDCPNFNNCPQFDVKYETKNRTVFILQKSSSFRRSCCPGWTKGQKRGKGCMAPICTSGCGDFGVCVKPEICQCPKGYEGEMCDTDIDECQNTDHGCQQICKNTAGSYMCACQTGFTLAEDGKTCNYCYKCQKEYTDLVLSVEEMKKELSDSILQQRELLDLSKTEEKMVFAKLKALEQDIRNLTEENQRLEANLLELHFKYETAIHEIERIENITQTTQAPPVLLRTDQPVTTTESTTTATTTTESAFQDQCGLEFSQEDMLYSLSN
ncbi:epidermal growth factor-like protein 7 isoform X2 [Mercenaria mercenaria]|uniref:epidermal growth factor-like protein 7 isoform X2 n=1 Tax=Mercenaria mercenaria TaxID=6596 RepID=UPI00234E5A93|nr:epidermal growth factor-like protein 7 isoform X2 [Mercenaria mercenaria]